MSESYCKLHDTHPADNEPCWQCINQFSKDSCHDDLVAACEKYQKMIELLFELNPKVEIVLGSALGLKQAEETGKAALAKAKAGCLRRRRKIRKCRRNNLEAAWRPLQ